MVAALTNALCAGSVPAMAAPTQVEKNLRAALKEALRIQDRFVAQPMFAKTGRGYLKSEGVSTIQKIKSNQRKRAVRKPA
jgi:hypothetical protein